MTKPLSDLKPGTVFRTPTDPRLFEVVSQHPGRVRVSYTQPYTYNTKDGEKEGKRFVKEDWSPRTVTEPLGGSK